MSNASIPTQAINGENYLDLLKKNPSTLLVYILGMGKDSQSTAEQCFYKSSLGSSQYINKSELRTKCFFKLLDLNLNSMNHNFFIRINFYLLLQDLYLWIFYILKYATNTATFKSIQIYWYIIPSFTKLHLDYQNFV